MKVKYRDCEINCFRDKSLSGDTLLFYSVFKDGFEATSGFSEGADTVKEYIKGLKKVVDDFLENPEEYDYE